MVRSSAWVAPSGDGQLWWGGAMVRSGDFSEVGGKWENMLPVAILTRRSEHLSMWCWRVSWICCVILLTNYGWVDSGVWELCSCRLPNMQNGMMCIPDVWRMLPYARDTSFWGLVLADVQWIFMNFMLQHFICFVIAVRYYVRFWHWTINLCGLEIAMQSNWNNMYSRCERCLVLVWRMTSCIFFLPGVVELTDILAICVLFYNVDK